jgi:hypothetical protein
MILRLADLFRSGPLQHRWTNRAVVCCSAGESMKIARPYQPRFLPRDHHLSTANPKHLANGTKRAYYLYRTPRPFAQYSISSLFTTLEV